MSRHGTPGDDYEVGYGKPPTAHQFKKGESGNPAGSRLRPGKKRKSKNLKAELLDELGDKIAVTANGKRRRLSRQAVLVKKLVADALNGNPKARDQLLRLANQPDGRAEAETEDLIGAAADAAVLAQFRAEIIAEYKAKKGTKK
jgi:hypothetical protein